ncbi:hypothetical protein ACLX1H_000346 [Fusarium chlamydosporum]
MLLLTPSSATALILALHSFSGVIAAPASDKVADIELTYGRDGEFGFLPVTGSKKSSTKAKLSVDNDYKVPSETSPKYHVLAADTTVTQLGVDPAVCHAEKDDNDTDSCVLDDEDDEDDNSDSKEKRSVFSNIFRRALSSDQKEALSLHNSARSKVKVKALKWDTSLEADALAYAKKIAKAGKMKHSDGKDRPGQGENLAYAWASNGFKNPITAGAKGWLNEKKNYKGEAIPKGNFSTYGHYTQCVWEKSTRVGIATAKDSKGAWYTVARYKAAGNVVGQKPY